MYPREHPVGGEFTYEMENYRNNCDRCRDIRLTIGGLQSESYCFR